MMDDKDLFPALTGFDSRKAAQAAAYFTLRAGGKIEKLKLIKLLYLAERGSMERYDHPMFYDEFYSLKDGPICSNALNGINGMIDQETWSAYIRRNGNIVIPVKRLDREELDEVSNADLKVLDALWERFKNMTSAQIRKFTHDECPEYEEVFKGRLPIAYASVFKALGKDNPQGLAEAVAEVRRISSALQG